MAALRRNLFIFFLFALLLSLCACGDSDPATEAELTLPVISPSPAGSSATLPSNMAESHIQSSPSQATTVPKSSEAVPLTTTADNSLTAGTTESSPAVEPTTESRAFKEAAALYLAGMDSRAKIFQLMIVTPEAICWDNPVLSAQNEELTSKPVAGILYQAKNMESEDQLLTLVQGHQNASSIPLFICVDEEGGRVSRIMETMGTTPIKNMYTYRGDGLEKARMNALTLATDIRRFGFNLDFAPVADVWSNPENKVIGERAYSDDFDKAAQLVAAAVKGFHQGNVICTLKHFPGHGDTLEDSHDHVATVNKSLNQLREEEFLPFIAGIRAGADMVMTGHLLVPDIDPENMATFSHKILTELLREELGFDGVIITDALEMGAVTAVGTREEICLKALQAGCDLLLCPAGQPENLTACADYLLEAIENGKLSWERVNESVLRVLELKVKYGLLDANIWTPTPTEATETEAQAGSE